MNHLLVQADARALPLADKSVQCVVTSPPYYALRDYGISGQIGLEKSPVEYIARMVDVFREVRRVLREDGTVWLNIGPSYAGGGNGGGGSFTPERRGFQNLSDATRKGITVVSGIGSGNEPFTLRDDLTVDELRYVLSELAAHLCDRNEVADPDTPIRVDEAVAPFTDSEKI